MNATIAMAAIPLRSPIIADLSVVLGEDAEAFRVGAGAVGMLAAGGLEMTVGVPETDVSLASEAELSPGELVVGTAELGDGVVFWVVVVGREVDCGAGWVDELGLPGVCVPGGARGRSVTDVVE